MKLRKWFIVVIALLCVWPLSCAKRPRAVKPEKPKKIKESPEGQTYLKFIESELERYEEEPELSLASIDEVIERNPGIGYFYYQRAAINADAGEWDKVIADCREALRLNPRLTNAKLLLGMAHGVQKRHNEATRILEEVRREDPTKEGVYALLAKEYINAKKYKRAERVMLDLLARDSEALLAYYYLGAIYGAYMNEPHKAINIYKRLLEREPENIQVIETMAALYLEVGKPQMALDMLLELEKLRPSDVALQLKVAQVLYKQKRYPEAIERFEKILERNPDSDKIMYYLGVLYEEVGRDDDAIRMYEQVPPVSGLYKDARLRLAYRHRQRGDVQESVEVLEEGIRKRPKIIEFYQYLGGIYEREGDYDSAIKVLVRATRYFPDDEDLYFALGTLYERNQEPDKAVGVMRKVLKLNPQNADALNYIGYTYVEQDKNLDQAEEMLQEAAHLKPDDGYILDSLGWLYFKKGDYTKASLLLERALKLEPKEPTVLKHMGQLHLRRGEKKKALEYFHKALDVWKTKERVNEEEVKEVVSLIQEALK